MPERLCLSAGVQKTDCLLKIDPPDEPEVDLFLVSQSF